MAHGASKLKPVIKKGRTFKYEYKVFCGTCLEIEDYINSFEVVGSLERVVSMATTDNGTTVILKVVK